MMPGQPPLTTPPIPVKLTTDLVVLTIREDRLKVLLVVRDNEPFRGRYALPGGFLRDNEDLETTAHRELAEETGLDSRQLPLQQLRTYSAVDRDPRGRVITTAFLAIAPNLPVPVGGSDARSAHWEDVAELRTRSLAFDHIIILNDALEKARTELEHTPLATSFCAETFTIADLRRVYELVWDVRIDNAGNFHRKVVRIDGFVESTGQTREAAHGGRAAGLFRRGSAKVLYPPLLRPLQAAPSGRGGRRRSAGNAGSGGPADRAKGRGTTQEPGNSKSDRIPA